MLRWSTGRGDARRRVPPAQFQPLPPFLGANVPVVTKAEFAGTGFTLAHLAGVRQIGYRLPSTLVVEVRRLLAAGEPFVYAYYEGIDKVAHEYGLGRALRRRAGRRRPPRGRPARRPAARRRARWSPPTTARSTAATASSRPTADVLVLVAAAVGRGPLPLAARPPRRRRRPARRRHAAPRRRGVGRHPRSRSVDEGWFGPADHRRRRAAWATWRSWPGTRWRSTIPPTAARSASSAATGRSRAAEMLVPLLAARRDLSDQDGAAWTMADGNDAGMIRCPEVVQRRELIVPPSDGRRRRSARPRRSSRRPRSMRIGSMVKQLLDEVRAAAARRAEPGAAAADLRHVRRRAGRALSPDLRDELEPLGPAVRR